MNLGKGIKWAEFIVATIIGVATLLFSIFIFVKHQSLDNFHITSIGKSQLFFFLNNGYQTTVLTLLLFVLVIILSTAWYMSKSPVHLHSGKVEGDIPVSLGFLFIYLVISVISSFQPSPVKIENEMGKLALALSFGQTVIIFSAFLFALTLVFSPLWNRENVLRTFISGNNALAVRDYGKAVIPAIVFAAIFYIFLGAGNLTSLEFFAIFVLLAIFGQRYGFIMAIFLLVVSLGSDIIGVNFTSFTGVFYPILVFLFAFIGLLTGFMTNVAFQKKGMESRVREQQETLEQSQGNDVLVPTPTPSNLKDSREMADHLFIRGTCPHCDSVEFYIKNGELECKKCKSVWSGHQTEFTSFQVGRDKRFKL